ncbi:acetyltransferase [Marmoricola endophyticus]|uniref:Acetyltransferase n=1 Tax=Marmoricola endophyticus TaxID=2040280 RepID=A0A917BHX8_9ACTN|nr:NeuD/PglB/VioB family sugar acetyltransferase [Marmoricola endophyticus]GGF43708.1 acetyltransferase [Marmoricola endophyticus]
MSRDLAIIGCGGLGREAVGIVDAINSSLPARRWNLIGFLDDNPSEDNIRRSDAMQVPILGSIEGRHLSRRDCMFVIAIGSPTARAGVAERLNDDARAATLVHPTAALGRAVTLGRGVIVAAYAQLACNIDVGDHVVVDRAVQVGHDCNLKRLATLHPSAVVSGDCTLGYASRVGTNATILPGVRIGDGGFVGAGACVTRDVEPGVTVRGVPAR